MSKKRILLVVLMVMGLVVVGLIETSPRVRCGRYNRSRPGWTRYHDAAETLARALDELMGHGNNVNLGCLPDLEKYGVCPQVKPGREFELEQMARDLAIMATNERLCYEPALFFWERRHRFCAYNCTL